MNIVICYGKHPYTTGEFIERSIRKNHNVFTIGTVNLGSTHDLIVEDPYIEIDKVLDGIDFKPDYILFIESGVEFYPRNIDKIKVPTLYYSIDSHFNYNWQKNYVTLFDNVIISFEQFTDTIAKYIDYKPTYVPHAYDSSIYYYNNEEKIVDISFVGDLSEERVERLKHIELLKKINIQIFSNVWGEDVRKIYASSKIVFNDNAFQVLNPRNFEASACKAVVLTNNAIGLDSFFKDGENIITYTNSEDILMKTIKVLHDNNELERLSMNALNVTENNSWDDRYPLIIEALTATIKREKDNFSVILTYALTHYKRGIYNISYEYLQKAINLRPSYYVPYLFVAKIFVNIGEFDNAKTYYNHILSLEHDFNEVKFLEILIQLQFDFAHSYNELAKLNVIFTNYDLKILLSMLHFNNEKKDESKELLMQCKNIDPYRFEADKYLKKFGFI